MFCSSIVVSSSDTKVNHLLHFLKHDSQKLIKRTYLVFPFLNNVKSNQQFSVNNEALFLRSIICYVYIYIYTIFNNFPLKKSVRTTQQYTL